MRLRALWPVLPDSREIRLGVDISLKPIKEHVWEFNLVAGSRRIISHADEKHTALCLEDSDMINASRTAAQRERLKITPEIYMTR